MSEAAIAVAQVNVGGLLKAMRAVEQIANPSSLTSLYRSVEIGPVSLRAVSEFGNILVGTPETKTTGVVNTILVDFESLKAVLSSLKPDSFIKFDEELNRIKWSCGRANGHLNHVQTDYTVPQLDKDNHTWIPDPNFGAAFKLAASACQFAAVSMDMYGVVVTAVADKIELMSCNAITLAKTVIPKGNFPATSFTVRPPVPSIIEYLQSACPRREGVNEGMVFDITDDGIFAVGVDEEGWFYQVQLPLSAKLGHDLKKVADNFPNENQKLKINQVEVAKFVKRARDLQEKKGDFVIKLSIENGQLRLKHNSIGSGTEEFFLTDGADTSINYPQVDIPADTLLDPLKNVDYIVLDYISQNNLILRGEKMGFFYVISGGTN